LLTVFYQPLLRKSNMQPTALTVKQLNLYVRSLIEGDVRLSNVFVQGEISNFKNHYSSGHLYFSLKDNDAAIRCVMFRSYAGGVKFRIEDGIQVILRGKVSLYEKDGQYQFYAEEIYPCGAGDIALRFEQTKARLEKEGMFEAENKRPLPKFPKRIAVITSETGAAVQDILNIISRRWPLSQIIMCPVAVQGENAVPQMIDALERVYNISDIDVIIIGRGGGSAEDLWAFNDESLARKIYESPVPVISAVGHETDFTICDFVADLRAPTPSAAAELAVPDCKEIFISLDKYMSILKSSLSSKYNLSKAKLERCANSSYFKNPFEFLVNRRYLELDRNSEKLVSAVKNSVAKNKIRFSENVARLENLSPLKILSRGYASASKNGKTLKSIKDVSAGEDITLRLVDGTLECNVTNVFKGEENV